MAKGKGGSWCPGPNGEKGLGVKGGGSGGSPKKLSIGKKYKAGK